MKRAAPEDLEADAGPLFKVASSVARQTPPTAFSMADPVRMEEWRRHTLPVPLPPALETARANAKAAAEHRRDLGVARSSSHAQRIDPAWKKAAVEELRLYAISHEDFLIEEVAGGFPVPDGADKRSWGSAVQEAKRYGFIEHAGAAPATSSNMALKPLWRAGPKARGGA